MSRRLLAVPLAVLGLLFGAGSALAAGPTAIGTGSDGVSYAGYATGGGIQRFAAADGSSAALPAWGTAGTGAGQLGGIVGIGVAPGTDGHVWVLDTNLRVQEFTKNGAFVRGTTLPACDTNVGPVAGKWGGIDVRVDGTSTTPVAIYVAHPCKNQVLKLDPDTLAVTQTQATTARPGHLASPRYLTGPPNTRALFVAFPGSNAGTVSTFALTDLAPVAGSTRTYDYTPTDVFIDEAGVLFVGDTRYQGIRLYDDKGNQFRYLGGTGTDPGLVNDVEAFDVAGQENSDVAGNLFIADSGNSRVQRFNSYGYTFWAAAATGSTGGPGSTTPVNTAAPTISGTATVGQQLTCGQGTWSNAPTSYAYSWRRDGSEVATGASYTLVSADAGRAITCVVTASNSGGSATSTSSAVSPTAAPPTVQAPGNAARPGIQGTATVGSALTCVNGTWTNAPTGFTYAWRRDGAAIAGATGTTYTLVAADAGKSVSCVVTATNAGGSTAAESDAVAVTAAPPTPTRIGVTINAGAEATNSASVTLTIRAPALTTAVVVSNDGSFDNPTQLPVAANNTYAWKLDARGSQRRARVVYVRFVAVGTDANQTFSDDILLDTTAPTVSAATVSSRLKTASAVVNVKASDSGSGVRTIQYASAKSAAKAVTVPAKKAKSFRAKKGTGAKVRWVRAIDVAGNKSRWKAVKLKAPRAATAKR